MLHEFEKVLMKSQGLRMDLNKKSFTKQTTIKA